METRFILQTIFEFAVAAFIIYGLFFEEKFVRAERRLFSFLKRRLRRALSARRSAKLHVSEKAS